MSNAASRPVILGILRFIMETERLSGWLKRIVTAADIKQDGHQGTFPSHTQSGPFTFTPPTPKTLDHKVSLPDYVRLIHAMSTPRSESVSCRLELCKGEFSL